MKKVIATTLVSFVALSLLSACAIDQADEPVTSSSAKTSSASPTSSPKAQTVKLLAHDSFVVSEDLITQLKADTGITLEVIAGGDAGAMVASAVLAAGSPTADVMFGVDNTLLTKAVNGGVFAPYTSPDLGALVPALQGDTGGGVVTPVDYGDVCLNYDKKWFADKKISAPASLDDLLKPEYKDLTVVEDPGTSSPGMAFLLATIAVHPDTWQDYWKSLKANGVKVAASWTDAYEGQYTVGGKGDRPIVVSYATSPPAEIVYASDPKPTEPMSGVMSNGCYRQIEYAGILAGTPNSEGAHQVLNWLISKQVQADVPLSMFVFPALADVALPEVFTKWAVNVRNPLQLPADEVAANSAGWLETWDSLMGR